MKFKFFNSTYTYHNIRLDDKPQFSIKYKVKYVLKLFLKYENLNIILKPGNTFKNIIQNLKNLIKA